MTLVTVAANWNHVVQVSDRRLTTTVGGIFSDEECKAISLTLPDADLLIGYTGIARIGSKSMNEVILECLVDATQQADFEAGRTVRALARALGARLRDPDALQYTRAHRRLSLMLTGFLYSEQTQTELTYQLVQALITNFQRWGEGDDAEAWDDFTDTYLKVKEGENWPTLVQRIGAYDLIPDMDGLRALLADGKPAVAVRDKMLELVPAAARNAPTVGSRFNAAVLRPRQEVEWSYHTDQLSWTTYFGDRLIAGPNGMYALRGAQVSTTRGGGATPIHAPRVPPARPCPCGSGKRYRQCHGRDEPRQQVAPNTRQQQD